jgi:predicted AlkP superfamily phosphohydrolase/phosphomutase
MSKIVIIGIDGLDPFLLDTWKDALPSFRDLLAESDKNMIESTTPPDSICAWASIFTGDKSCTEKA